MKSGGKFCLPVAVVLLGLGSAVARPADAVVAADGSGDYTSI